MPDQTNLTRRRLLQTSALAIATPLLGQSPAFIRSDRPQVPMAVMSGDVYPDSAIVWTRANEPSRMIVKWKTAAKNEQLSLTGPHCLDVTDFTGRVELAGLPPDSTILYEVQLQSLANSRSLSEPLRGQFRTPPAKARDVSFLWSGDQVGQGWGINESFGGMRIFDQMFRAEPDFFIHSGDTVYADGLLQSEIKLPDGKLWRNIVTEEKSKVAETLDEYRGQYRYNLLDRNFRNFTANVAQLWQWDDHETMNNWSPSKNIQDDPKYKEKSVSLLTARSTRAFQEYAPLRTSPQDAERVYRKISYGPLLDVFMLDMRSYRGPNTWNRQTSESAETQYFGSSQMRWLQQSLRESKAVWKAIACDMPIGITVPDGRDEQGRPRFENSGNGDGPPLGRELEIKRLLKFIKEMNIRNTVWFTADVHYTAAHYLDPRKAQYTEFLPFWEFVSGPLNAGCFPAVATDNTFGTQVVFVKEPPKGQFNLGPSTGMQFYGEVKISARTKAMTVVLRDMSGAAPHTQELPTEA